MTFNYLLQVSIFKDEKVLKVLKGPKNRELMKQLQREKLFRVEECSDLGILPVSSPLLFNVHIVHIIFTSVIPVMNKCHMFICSTD